MKAPLRIKLKAKTIEAKAHENRLVEKTAELARQLGLKLTVSIPARKS